jgi:hypothetical protein
MPSFLARRSTKSFLPKPKKRKPKTAPKKPLISQYTSGGARVQPIALPNPGDAENTNSTQKAIFDALTEVRRLRADRARIHEAEVAGLLKQAERLDAAAAARVQRLEREEEDALASADASLDPDFVKVRGEDDTEWRLLPADAHVVWSSEHADIDRGVAKARAAGEALIVNTTLGEPQVRYAADGRVYVARPEPSLADHVVVLPR